MGGPGSGPWMRSSSRQTTLCHPKLDVRFSRDRLQTGAPEIVWQRVGFGERRMWRCPECGGQRQFVYLASDGGWACRSCVGLLFESQYAEPWARLFTKTMKLGFKIGLNIFEGEVIPTRPKRMRKTKYAEIVERLRELDRLTSEALQADMEAKIRWRDSLIAMMDEQSRPRP